jgi:hypothetical protein
MSFKIYIFGSSDFNDNEYRFGITDMIKKSNFEKYWEKKFKNVNIKFFSEELPDSKKNSARYMIRKHVNNSFRISKPYGQLEDIARDIVEKLQNEIGTYIKKEEKYLNDRLQEAEYIKLESLNDRVSDEEEEPNESDEDFIGNDDYDDDYGNDYDYNYSDFFNNYNNDESYFNTKKIRKIIEIE